MPKDDKKLDVVQKYYIRDGKGEIDYKHPYDLIEKTNCDGLYEVHLDGHVGFMNENGEIITPINYDETRTDYKGEKNYYHTEWSFYDDYTMITKVYKDNRVGVVSSRGEEIVPCKFESAEVFTFSASEHFIPVAMPNKDNSDVVWGLYDIKNKRVSVVPRYERIDREHNGYASFREGGKWGLLHCATGTVVMQAIYLVEMRVYDNVCNTGFAIAYLGGTHGVWNVYRLIDPDETQIFYSKRLSYLGLCIFAKQNAHVAKPLFLLLNQMTSIWTIVKLSSHKIHK